MPAKLPSISVVISTYNDRNLVGKKLDEIKRQTAFSSSEFIFVETNSPGGERELLEPFCEDNPNCILLARDERFNLYAAWNEGWRAARSKFVCISNMDDIMHPNLLRRVVDEMEASNWDLASVLITKQRLGTSWVDLERLRKRGLTLSTRPGPFFAWRRELKDKISMFDDRMTVAGDKDFWARATDASIRIGLIPEILYIYSKHPGQLSKNNEYRMRIALDMKIADEKAYTHQWPSAIQKSIRRYRLFQNCFGWSRFDSSAL